MRQLSFVLDIYANCPIYHTIKASPFVRPEEFLSVVNQNGKVKLHALVDDRKPETEHTILIVGTGQSVPVEHLDSLYKIGSVLVNENQYGYHLYYLGEPRGEAVIEEKDPKFQLQITWAEEEDQRDFDFESLNALIDNFVQENEDYAELVSTADDVLTISFFDESFRKHSAFSQLMIAVSTNSAVKEFALVTDEEAFY